MEDIFQEMDAEKNGRFQKLWSKLDKGSKLNRLILFVKLQKLEEELNDSQENQLKTLLYQLCESGALNKISDVIYCEDTHLILTIKNLELNEDTKKYTFKKVEKKKNVSKSKTNIEKHLNRSKTNKTL